MKHYETDELYEFCCDECSGERKREIAAHLETCPSCAELAAQCSAVSSFISSVPHPDLSQGFTAAVMAKVLLPDMHRKPRLPEVLRAWAFPVIELACTAALLMHLSFEQAVSQSAAEVLLFEEQVLPDDPTAGFELSALFGVELEES